MLQTSHALFLPILAQMLLTILVYISLARAKAAALKSGTANLQRTALHADAWPESVIKVNNNLRNQFELPVLFYVVCFVLAATGAAGPVVRCSRGCSSLPAPCTRGCTRTAITFRFGYGHSRPASSSWSRSG
jgi:hypothetical protein